MNICKLFVAAFCLVLFCAFSVPSAVMANEWDQATKLTFSEPVEVPGKVLPAGSYWFKVLDDDSNRNLVQIWNSDRTHLITTILAIPDSRQRATDNTVIKFDERPGDQPEAIEAWFYPGETDGHEFVYPRTRASELAKQNARPVLYLRDEVVSKAQPSALKQEPVKALSPTGDEVEIKDVLQQPIPVPKEADHQ